MEKLIAILNKLGACEEAIEWLSSQTNLQQAWKNCERGDWLLWLVAALRVDEKKLFLAKGQVAREVIHLMSDERSRMAVRAAIDFGKGKISKDELKKVALTTREAVDATSTAYNETNTAAAHAAAHAAYAAFYTISSAPYNIVNYIVDTSIENKNNDLQKLLELEKAAKIIKTIFSFGEVKAKINNI